MATPLLQIRNLGIATQTRHGLLPVDILKGIDVDLARGQVLGLIGESGAGKSTLGLAALGYLRRGLKRVTGNVTLDSKLFNLDDVTSVQEMRGRLVCYVAQSAAAAFNPAHKLLNQVIEVAQIHGNVTGTTAKKRALELFGRMGLPDPEQFGNRYPHEVSGGQLQRAMTAMALVGQPDLIVFDEPTTALDVTTQIDVLAIIKDVIEEFGTAAIYVSHDLAVVAQIADRIKVLRHGAEIEEQATRDLLDHPREAYTRELLAVRHAADVKPRAVEGGPILAVENVSAAYGPSRILDDINIELRQGANLAIVGESGSGKSTLARVITGLLPPVSGQVRHHGRPLPAALRERSRSIRKNIQLIYQSPDIAMNPRQRVFDIVGRAAVRLAGLSKREAHMRARELLEMVELSVSLGESFPGQLSGGQKQRVCIARALAADPEIIICDEITSALDPLVAEGIIKLLARTQDAIGVSYIFITHDIGLVRSVADDVVVMREGRVVEQGPRADIFTPPYDDYTHLLISSTPITAPGWLEQVVAARRTEAAGH
ncbi:MAG: ABC transporter [Alphaproteobacteria bacterium]|nr:ABC transporter [Alphaproteobacteria bacterium]